MMTWILLAIVVAALFGIINLDQVREWTVQKSRESWPHIESFFHRMGEKMDSAKAKVENTKENINNKVDQAKDKAEEYKEKIENKFDEHNDNNNNY